MKAYLAIQCTALGGETGTFLFFQADDGFIPVSPVCRDMVELLTWIKAHGWKTASYDPAHPVGTYEKISTVWTADEMAAYYRSTGYKQVTMKELEARLDELGYRLERLFDCRAPCKFMNGDMAGAEYPCCTAYAVQKDNGIGWANVDARKDSNWEALKDLRNSVFAVNRGAIYEL